MKEDWTWDDLVEALDEDGWSAVDDEIARWLAGEDVSDYEDDGTIAEIKEDDDGLE